jgi:hypothetical protein
MSPLVTFSFPTMMRGSARLGSCHADLLSPERGMGKTLDGAMFARARLSTICSRMATATDRHPEVGVQLIASTGAATRGATGDTP